MFRAQPIAHRRSEPSLIRSTIRTARSWNPEICADDGVGAQFKVNKVTFFHRQRNLQGYQISGPRSVFWWVFWGTTFTPDWRMQVCELFIQKQDIYIQKKHALGRVNIYIQKQDIYFRNKTSCLESHVETRHLYYIPKISSQTMFIQTLRHNDVVVILAMLLGMRPRTSKKNPSGPEIRESLETSSSQPTEMSVYPLEV